MGIFCRYIIKVYNQIIEDSYKRTLHTTCMHSYLVGGNSLSLVYVPHSLPYFVYASSRGPGETAPIQKTNTALSSSLSAFQSDDFISYILIQQVWNGPFSILRGSLNVLIFTISADPDEMPHHAAFHPGLHCFPKYPYRGFQFKKEFSRQLTWST